MIDTRFFQSRGPLSLDDIIKALPVEAGGAIDTSATVSSAAALAESRPGDLTYLAGRKHLKSLETAGATACLTASDFAQAVSDAGIIPLITQYPRAQYARVLRLLFTLIEADVAQSAIHSSAQVSPGATLMPGVFIAQNTKIGARTKIGHGTYIGPGVEIGDDCYIGAHVSVECAIIGNSVTVGASSVIGQRGFGVAKDGETNIDIPHLGRVLIEDHVTLGSHCAIDRGMLEDTIIGSGSKFDNFCQVAHNVKIGKNCLFAGFAGLSGSCVIGDNVVMGGRVGLADHLTVGDGAQLAANAGLMKNIPPGEIWSGYPAKPLRQHMKEIATLSRLAAPKKKS